MVLLTLKYRSRIRKVKRDSGEWLLQCNNGGKVADSVICRLKQLLCRFRRKLGGDPGFRKSDTV
jgi:hypothetical protein